MDQHPTSFILAGILVAAFSGGASASDDSAKLDFFEKNVRPLLVDNCFNCHSANTNAKGGSAG